MTTQSPELVQDRKDMNPEDKWNVESLYASLSDWKKSISPLLETKEPSRWPELIAFKGRLNEGPQILKEILILYFSLSRELEKLYTYAHLKHDEETTQDEHKGAFQQVCALLYDFQQESAWLQPELLSLSSEKINQYLKSPELSEYRFYIEKILRLKPHTRSSEEEALLAMASKPMQAPSQSFSALNNADLRFENVVNSEGNAHPLSHGLYQLYLRSPDRHLRKSAFTQMHKAFSQHENTLAEMLYGQLQTHAFQAQARNYSSCVESALYPKNIPTAVYTSLVETVRKGLPDTLHRYAKMRKKALKLDTLHLYDMYAPLVAEMEIKMDYPEAEALVIESVAPLGKEYQILLAKGLQKQRWVDRFENKNKRSGAYSSGCYDSFPYILLNFRNTLRDVFTLAHEAGHSMHSLLSHNTQPYHSASYPIFVAEVASTFNEELLMDLLLKQTTDPQKRLYLLLEKIEDIRATLFRQTMFAEFELTIHELVESNTPVTPTLLKELYFKLNQDYFGPAVTIDEMGAIEWARIPHFYYNFYVYQYATGISAALSLADKVLNGAPQNCENYLTFLKGGDSLFPIDLLKLAGIDMTTPAPVEDALKRFKSLLTEVESLIS